METIFGFKWPVPSAMDIAIIIFIFLVIIFIFLLVYFNLFRKNIKAEAFHLFLFKVKNIGLSTYKIKILHSIVDSLSLRNPIKLLNKPLLFESAINRYNNYLIKQKETIDTMKLIYEEIIEIYQSLYHPSLYKKELKKITDLDKEQLLRIIIDNRYILIGKISEFTNRIKINICTRHKRNLKIKKDQIAEVYLFRTGDARYRFTSRIMNIDRRRIEISLPQTLVRIKPVRWPDIDVEMKCILEPVEGLQAFEKQAGEEKIKKNGSIKSEEIEGHILKLNLDEASINIQGILDFKKEYHLEFEILDFKLIVRCIILSEKKLKTFNSHYYTVKFIEMSDAGKKVLKGFIREELKFL